MATQKCVAISVFRDCCTHRRWRPDGVTAAYWIREPNGAGSIPAWGSAKTNEEVLAKLLTWASRPGDTSSSQGWWGNLPALLHFSTATVIVCGILLDSRVQRRVISPLTPLDRSGDTEMCRHFFVPPQLEPPRYRGLRFRPAIYEAPAARLSAS